MTFFSNLIFIIHSLIMCTVFIGPYILPVKYLHFYIFFVTLMTLQWFIFGGCFLTTLETGQLEEDFIARMIKLLTGWEINQKKLNRFTMHLLYVNITSSILILKYHNKFDLF